MSDVSELLAALGGRFELLEQYVGGEGQTLHVAPRSGGAPVVLKVLAAGRLALEASLLLSMRHPAIPAVLEVGRLPDGRAFVVREHVTGQALRTLSRDPIALRDELQQLLEVLAYVHLRGVLHLDLKPANLLRGSNGRLHLLDFGLGARSGGAGGGGTLFFASPEVLLGGVPDARADLFAVGAMVAQALWPGSGPPLARFLECFPREDFFVAGGLQPTELPAPFADFVARCVERSPQRRFPDAQAALEFLTGGSGRPSPTLLIPDPVLVYAIELATITASDGDVVLSGAGAADRRALALHLAGTLVGVRAVEEHHDELRVVHSTGRLRRVQLPRLAKVRVLDHLRAALGLRDLAASAAAEWLVERAGDSAEAIGALLQELVGRGEIVPSGARWTWPAARNGRLAAGPGMAPTHAVVSPQRLQALAASGHREAAFAGWQRAAAQSPTAERPLRLALAEGLLDGGEPSAAMPLCFDAPVLRAQCLLDTGQVIAAAQTLACDAESPANPRRRRVEAQIAMAGGQLDRARELLEHADATAIEQVTLAAVHESAGRGDAAAATLRELAKRPDLAELPFVRASAHTVRGHLARARGDLVEARDQFQAAAALLFRIGHVRHAATAQQNLGIAHKDLGEHALATERLREAHTLFQQIGDAVGVARTTASRGIAALARGDAAAARPWLETAVTAMLQLGDLSAMRMTKTMLARVLAELGEGDAARACLQELGEPDSERMRAEMARVHETLASGGSTRTTVEPTPTMQDRPASGPSRELFRTFLSVNRQLAQEPKTPAAVIICPNCDLIELIGT